MNELILSALPTALRSRLIAWGNLAQGSYAPATESAVASDVRLFAAWCQEHGHSPLPASPETVAEYLRAESEAGRAVATVKRRASSIAMAHRAAGEANPCRSEAVRLAIRALARTKGTQQQQAKGLTRRDADRIVAGIDRKDARPKDVRDLALLLVGRDLLARASELVGLKVEDVAWDEDGTATVSLRRYKTSTEAGEHHVGGDAATALKRWLAVSGIESGPVFVGLTRRGLLTGRLLSRHAVTAVLRELADAAQVRKKFSAHSLRVGMAQDLVADHISTAAIMQAGGWSSERMVARYTKKLNSRRGAIAQYYARR